MSAFKRTPIVMEALDIARDRVVSRLMTAVRGYFDGWQRRRPDSSFFDSTGDTLASLRKQVTSRMDQFFAEDAECRTALAAALAAFDEDVKEIEAWETAARAGEKLTRKP